MSELQRQIRQRTRFRPESDLLRQMGYANPNHRHRKRLTQVLADPELGLGKPEYDFVHDCRSFLHALCRALGIPENNCQAFIAKRDANDKAERQAFKPWLFVDTGFRRCDRPGMPLFALALMERHRRLVLAEDTWRMPWHEQLTRAQSRVREHMAESGGELQAWGRIQRYLFCYAEGRKLAIAPSGEVLGDASERKLPQASFTLKGKPVSVLLNNGDSPT
ncbi:hypothetical protein [Halomonas marinisediminis]|uniref:Uncharacterized protein n=1 Tax=Halomonas marinisediminis TaxID=2546095 RepID=A0ABY2DAC8_9GAMM|nr:hypothetical protein [Halomonas marinisediminis]TDB05119.1 hypothetical protein E0702_02705 [Halomonas marinisediminis]